MQLLAIFYGVFIGIGLITGILHLFVGLRRRPRDPVHLTFAIMTLLITVVVFTDSGYRFATTIQEAILLFNWGISVTALALIALLWFVAFYTGYAPRRFLMIMTGFYLMACIVSASAPTGLLYAGNIQLESRMLPWGEPFVHVSGDPSNWQIYNISLFVATYAYIFSALIRQYRHGERRAALTLLTGLSFVMVGTIFDFLIDFDIITHSIGLYALSYIGLIIVMSLGLADDVVRTGVVQNELQENERRWRTLLNGIEQIVVGLNQSGQVNYVNPYFEKTTGYGSGELLGKDWFQTLVPEDDRPELEQTFSDILENNFHRHYRNDILTREGQRRTITWANVRLRDVNGAIIGSLSVGQDITDQLAAQAALERHQHELEDLVAARTAELQVANIELSQQHQAAERRRHTAEGFAMILAALNTNQPLNELLAYLTVHADHLLGSDASMVVNATDPGYRVVASTVPDGHDASARTLCDVAMQRVANGGEPSGFAVSALRDAQVELNGYASVLTIPLFPRDAPDWGIVLYYVQEQAFNQDDLDNAAILQGQMLLAIENTQLRRRMADQAVAKERNRLSRELHDSVTQNLYTISTLADVMPDLVDSHPEELAGATNNLRLLATGALAEMRALLLELRPAVLLEKNLGELLQQLVDGQQSRTHTKLMLSVVNDRVFPTDVQIALYRIAQEALNNVIKHAAAGRATVGLYCTAKWTTLRIHDDGCGFVMNTESHGHFGLENLHERARQINATFDLNTRPGQGTEIIVKWHG